MTAHANDIAAAILERCGPLDTFKLQKLVYYTQAWHLTWFNAPAFEERLEAWDKGPVVRELFREHRREYVVADISGGNASDVGESAHHIIEFVCNYYGDQSGQQLVERVHGEPPWKDAYEDGGRNSLITHEAMVAYFRSLDDVNDQAWVWTTGAYEHVARSLDEVRSGPVAPTYSVDDFLSSL